MNNNVNQQSSGSPSPAMFQDERQQLRTSVRSMVNMLDSAMGNHYKNVDSSAVNTSRNMQVPG
ncbi:MAG: hypothetical protein P1U63_08725 [Coxiellaceae bacterium]|nr:hypothetical protein [Coxiellaceae bacterium]